MITDADDDMKLFEQEMAEVNPLHSKNRKSVCRGASKSPKVLHPAPSVILQPLTRNTQSSVIDCTPDWGPVEFFRAGLQKNFVNRFKRGNYPYQDSLDLHSYTKTETASALYEFISTSLTKRFRCVLIVHGKGEGILRRFTMDWLKEINQVMGFSTAQQSDGGTGALYVLLKSKPPAQNIKRST